MTQIVDLVAPDTHDLRRRVLRTGTPSSGVEWEGDDDDSTFHLGVVEHGQVVAISTWIHRSLPDRCGELAVQLRGMATEPARRGHGLGGRLLDAGLERCGQQGVAVVWARARVGALSLYRRHGFVISGPEFVDATTGLTHRVVVNREIPFRGSGSLVMGQGGQYDPSPTCDDTAPARRPPA